MSKQFTHIELHASGRYDPTKTRMICEAPGCTQEFVVADGYSTVAVCWALTGPLARHASQCPEQQHFACSPECLRSCMLDCFDHHLMPLHAQKVAQAQAYAASQREGNAAP